MPIDYNAKTVRIPQRSMSCQAPDDASGFKCFAYHCLRPVEAFSVSFFLVLVNCSDG